MMTIQRTLRIRVWCAAGLMWCIGSPAFPAHPLVSEDTGTQGAGGNQIEWNADGARDAGARTNTAALTYTRGIAGALDIFLNTPTTWKAPAGERTGLNDMSLGAKWRFYDREGISLGVKPEWVMATGDEQKGLGNGKNGYGVTLMAQIETGGLTWLLNYGVSRHRFALQADRNDYRGTIHRSSVAVLYGLTERLKGLIDIGQSSPALKAESSKPRFMVLGAIYALSEDLDLDFGFKKGLNSAETDRQWGGGLTWRFR